MRTIGVAIIFALVIAVFCSPVAAQNNPVPFLNSPTVPAAAVPGGAAFTLTVNGAGFASGAKILWNGSARTTTFVSGIQLKATVLASDIATPSLASVTVSNPSPGGGVSNPVLFSVTTPTTSLAFTRSESEIPGGGNSWVSQPVGLVAGSNLADGTPVLVLANGMCPFLAVCVLDKGSIVEVGELGFYSQDIPDSPQTIVIGNFNGDSTIDIVTVGQLGTGQPNPNLNLYAAVTPGAPTGPGFLATIDFALVAGTSASPAPVVGDFNRDGHLDIVTGGQSSVYFVPGNGDATLGTPISSNTESSMEGGLVAGDFNRDGILDLAVTNTLLNSVSILLGNGNGTFKAAVDYATGSTPGSIVAGDFNEDGKLDLAVLDGAGKTVSILLGNGDGTFKPNVEYPAGFSTSSLSLGDYNGDGILDIAISDTQCTNSACPASGSVNILLGNGDGTFQSQLDFAAGGEPKFIVTTGLVTVSPTLVGRAGIAVANYLDNSVSIFSPLESQSGGGNPFPAITSISPTNAIEGSGSFTLTVNGNNFISSSTIGFGGQTEPTTFVSASQLTAVIPGSAITTAGFVTVTVINPAPGGGTVSTTFNVLIPPPTISSIVPAGVIVGSPGFTLTINGTNFDSTAAVIFNGLSGIPRTPTLVSSTQLTVPVLASDVMNLGTIAITVRNSQGTSPSITLTVLPSNAQPTIASLIPNAATAGGPAFTMGIIGSGFGTSSTVTFGSKAVSSAYVNPTTLQASIPASAIATAGTPLVTVANPGGSPSAGSPFTVGNGANNPVPAAVSLSPASVSAGNSSLTLNVTGSNFVQGSVVQVNGSARPTSFVNSTSLTATLPATDFAHGGTLNVTVNNPTPGGGTTGTLSVIVTDYSVIPPSSSPPVTAGLTANFVLTISPSNGTFSNPVTFTVSALPMGATASFTPSTTVTPGTTAQAVTLSITTMPRTAASATYYPGGERPVLLLLCLVGMAIAMAGFMVRSTGRRVRRLAPQFLLALLLVAAAGLVACAGGGSTSPQVNPATGTPAGTYPITITATSGGVSHSTTVTLTVM